MQRSDREVGREDGLDRWGEWIGGEVRWVCGSDVCGSEVRWVCGRSTGSEKLTVSLCLARWSDWLDRWSTGWAGSGVLVWIGVSLSSHSPWVYGVWLGDHLAELDVTEKVDRCRWLDQRECFLSFSRSLAGLELSFFLWLSLSFAWPRNDLKWKWECKIISGSKE